MARRSRGGPQRRLDRCVRGRGAARWRRPLRGKGVEQAVRTSWTSSVPRSRAMTRRAAADRPDDARLRRHREQGGDSARTRSSASPSPWPGPRPSLPAYPCYRYVGGPNAHVLPVPMMNILNGGAHADSNVDIQEFMIAPIGAPTFREALRGRRGLPRAQVGAQGQGPGHRLGDEGGFAPNLDSNRAALDLIVEAIGTAGLTVGNRYRAGPGRRRQRVLHRTAPTPSRAAEVAGRDDRLLRRPRRRFPLVSIEDPLDEEDWDGWKSRSPSARRPRSSSSATTCS
jgi:hypothetical protein